MKVKLKNLGILEQAEFELGDLTIICGDNNSGKTYATYALFGFLHSWKNFIEIEIEDTIINQVLNDGLSSINILEYLEKYKDILFQGCKKYSRNLPDIFAANEDRFRNTEFQIDLDIDVDSIDVDYENLIGPADSEARIFSLIKKKNSYDLIVTVLTEKEKVKIPREIIRKFIGDSIKSILFDKFIPKPFIASAERTGTAIFRKELNFAKNRLLEEISQVENEIDRIELLFKGYDDYALPIKTNVEFTRTIESIAKRNSEFSAKMMIYC